MKKNHHKIHVLAAVAMSICYLPAAYADTSSEPKTLTLSGFGTFGIVKTNNELVEFRSYAQAPNGTANRWEMENESRLGLQLAYSPNESFRGVVQLLSRRNERSVGEKSNFYPAVDWAYVAYSPSKSLNLRAGRFVAPAFLASESRAVGYANVWIRPPVDLYAAANINNIDGVDLLYRGSLFGWTYAAQTYAGSYNLKFATQRIKYEYMAGANLTVENGPFLLRLGYMDARSTTYNKADQILPTSLATRRTDGTSAGTLNPTTTNCLSQRVSCSTLFENYNEVLDFMKRDKKPMNLATIGYTYDDGEWYSQGEYLYRKGGGSLANSESAYLTVGYRFGKFLPHLTVSKANPQDQRIELKVAPAFEANLRRSPFGRDLPLGVVTSNAAQESIGLGVRYDVATNIALKIQWDHMRPKATANAPSFGLALSPTNGVPGKAVTVTAIALDFVF